MRGAVATAVVVGALCLAPSVAQGGRPPAQAPPLVPLIVLDQTGAPRPLPAPPAEIPRGRAVPQCFHDSPGSPCTYWCEEPVAADLLVPRDLAPRTGRPRCDRRNPRGALRFAAGR